MRFERTLNNMATQLVEIVCLDPRMLCQRLKKTHL
jgi:hypothetical protein